MRIAVVGTIALLAGALMAPAVSAGMISKSFVFKEGVTLEVGAETHDGLRLDTVQFRLPAPMGDRANRVAGLTAAQVAISNVSGGSRKVGVAIALFDEAGRLLGVASGGTALIGLKPDRQKSYTLVFDGVNSEVHKAAKFQISLESKP